MIKVSILIPTFNRAEMLKRAIESALSQDYYNLEVIVSDNASEDNTPEIVKEFLEDDRFKYYRNEKNLGLVNNFKKLVLEHMTGDYFILLSDDDYLIKNDYISKAADIIENNNVLMVYSDGYLCFDDVGIKHEIRIPFKEIENGKTIFMNYLKVKNINSFICNVIFNRDFAIRSNSFNNKYNLAFDMELFLKSCLCGEVGIIKEFSSVYNYHIKNLSSNLHKTYEFIVNRVDSVVEPYNMAMKYNKLSDDEKDEWENRVIFKVFLTCVAHTLFYFPEKHENTLKFLADKNKKVFQKLSNNKIYKLMIFANKIHIFNTLYKIQNFIIQNKFKYQI
jgi:glycosyltransferase involved in cell wall biosynthesis